MNLSAISPPKIGVIYTSPVYQPYNTKASDLSHPHPSLSIEEIRNKTSIARIP